MRAGELDRRVTIEQPTETRDSYGEPVTTWSELATVWASREDMRGQERFTAQQVHSELTTVFRMRYRDDVTTKMRLKENGVIFDIEEVVETGRREGLEITTKEDQRHG